MSTIKSAAYQKHPACMAYEAAWNDLLVEWINRTPSPDGDAELRLAHQARREELIAVRDGALAAEGLRVVEGWEQGTNRNAWLVELQPIGGTE